MGEGTEVVGSGEQPRILIVEDDPVSALLLRKVLESRGYPVDHAQDGVEALEVFRQGGHRIVISDWMMPELDGVSLCQEMRKISGSYVYVILLSAKGQRADRLQAFEAGIDDFLTKPLDREDLFARLNVARRILETEEDLRLQKEELACASDRLKMANHNLILASRRFEELFSGMPVACFTFDVNGHIHEWNREAESLFGIRPEEALLQYVWEALPKTEDPFWTQELVAQIFQGKAMSGLEWVFSRDGTESRHLMCNIFPLRSPQGEILGAISANLDITERKIAEQKIEEQMQQINVIASNLEQQKRALEEANHRLSELAITDGLTGLWNHRRFQEELDAVYAQHLRRSQPMSLIFLDVDHFKQFNDVYGHPAGDDVLREVAGTLQEVSRAHEAVARYGGEEFAIILPDCDAEQAKAAAERFRAAIAKKEWPHRPITASFGVATANGALGGVRELIQWADAALYAAKDAGRNCTAHYDELSEAAASRPHLGLKRSA
jgi:two-component system, cell cycle response regulator